ncbi:endo-1,4-beta-xylanase-like protein [Legionella lansingensis]|uniref:Endo-1,4-beta-xylanase-like protein n=1 Tax=Legionella lansingensis TaxID=45067 RepID=A0A0W0VGD0_9GAMM|nr:DUF3298 and DUF4163 domain-containing protein [Legionella lansingensis]KTD18838.1 endo-1,4-beta-xylanase-like protein [Legionella lansingensis]SNV52845.1 endo-1,4-beta-xylanase-like protein [Legionella lansingensis]
MQKYILAIVLMSVCLVHPALANTPKTVVVKKETATFDLDLKYPQGFADKNIDKTVKAFIDETQKADANPDAKDVPDAPGKNSLYVDYKTEFQNKNAISLLFTISVYNRGAAHPNNTVKSFNFIHGKEITLTELFKPNSEYLLTIAKLSKAALQEKKISDENWLTTGTNPTAENYRNWYFTADGLAIVFDTYQVAAYVYGPQTVMIAKSKLKNLLRPEIVKAVWGSQ